MRLSGRSAGIVAGAVILGCAALGVYARLAGRDVGAAVDARAATMAATDELAGPVYPVDQPIPVEGARVVRDTLVLRVRAEAQAAAWRQTTVLSEVGGMVRTVPVRESSAVAPGSRLVQIDTTEYALAAEEARARLRQAQAQYRELTLFDESIENIPVRLERQRAARAKSGLDAAEVAVRRAELDLLRTRVTSPFAGRVADLRVVPGQRVRAGDELLTITTLDPIRVEVQVLEGDVGFLSQGGRVRVVFSALPGESFTGHIATINPLVDPARRTARVSVSVRNPGGRILPGFYAVVSLDARRFPDRVLVPRAAILERDRRTMLFVYQAADTARSGHAQWRYVTTGLDDGDVVEIVESPGTEMVEPGEVVLVGGHFTLTHDARVRLTANVRPAGGRP